MKLLQINFSVNTGSTGRIAEGIGEVILENGYESYIAFGRKQQPSKSRLIKVGDKKDVVIHGLYTRLFDRHGFASTKATKELINKIENIEPDVIGLHNIHGYYLNIRVLFEYLKSTRIPIVWTFHDCWPFTGHCVYFSFEGCEKWKTHCQNCPLTHTYPKSSFIDNSFKNFNDKRKIFIEHPNLTIVTPSKWLKSLVQQSFLNEYSVKVINNGIDLSQFRILDKAYSVSDLDKRKKVILGVASIWEKRKGLKDFISLSKMLDDNHQIVLIGVNKNQKKNLPKSILGISRTENIHELVKWYNRADVFVNTTYEDNFPTTNLEALACGTPVITYKTGGSPETIDCKTGIAIEQGNLDKLSKSIEDVLHKKEVYQSECRNRAETYFDKNDRFLDYLKLYKNIL